MNRIDGTTKLAGVVGHPLGHSLSPAMHNAVYEHLGLNWVYVPFDVVDEAGLRRFAALAPSLPFVGFNVTMPYKRAMLELCDEVATAASMAGAVNTVHVVDDMLVGYNTDGRGLLEALDTGAGFSPAGKNVVIIGAGGAAGAAFVAFLLAKPARLTLVSRDVSPALDILARMNSYLGGVSADAIPLSDAEDEVRQADLIVNATPVGMRAGDASPVPTDWLRAGHIVYDMVYGTAEPTALLSDARSVGASALDGLGMLVCQGATAVDIWNEATLAPTPRDVMLAAAQEELRGRATRVAGER